MFTLRTETKPGSGIVSSLVGLIFILTFLVSAAKLTEMVLLTQRLNALAADSVRRLTVGSGIANPNSEADVESRIDNLLPTYKNDLAFSLQRTGNLLTFQIRVSDYSITVWPGLGAGPFTLSATASSHMES